MLVVTALPNVGLRLWLGSVITSLAVHGGGKVAELRAASRGQQSRPGHPPLDIRPAPLQPPELGANLKWSFTITEKGPSRAIS